MYCPHPKIHAPGYSPYFLLVFFVVQPVPYDRLRHSSIQLRMIACDAFLQIAVVEMLKKIAIISWSRAFLLQSFQCPAACINIRRVSILVKPASGCCSPLANTWPCTRILFPYQWHVAILPSPSICRERQVGWLPVYCLKNSLTV